eukprot:TRINITY_DN93521_c0_g1_i1.p1 TRINITY_DN93521_c0_g1~~TRINITY_DN93521_c0_g1_i1.p1  ORF type:complete len:324 (+),score=61.73 TRINITY_DN93521_c0_g1_i1:83-973(+)
MATRLMMDLEGHLANDDLVKGWEATRRTCIGRARGPLRQAARNVNAVRSEDVLAGQASAAAQRRYVSCIEALHRELEKAGEQDFDGMLREALDWLTAKQNGYTHKLPATAELTEAQVRVRERIRDYRFINSPGHVGRAVDRDLRKATDIAKQVRTGFRALHESAGDVGELLKATAQYVDASGRFCEELRHAGEPDFDGLLRQAVMVLDGDSDIATTEDTTAIQNSRGDAHTEGAKGSRWKGAKGSSKGKGDGSERGGKSWHAAAYSSQQPAQRTRRWAPKQQEPASPTIDETLVGA